MPAQHDLEPNVMTDEERRARRRAEAAFAFERNAPVVPRARYGNGGDPLRCFEVEPQRDPYLVECARLYDAYLAAFDVAWPERDEAVRAATKAFVDHVNTRRHGCALCGATDLKVGEPHRCDPGRTP